MQGVLGLDQLNQRLKGQQGIEYMLDETCIFEEDPPPPPPPSADPNQPPPPPPPQKLFVIHKHQRHSASRIEKLATYLFGFCDILFCSCFEHNFITIVLMCRYYILSDGCIYQAPNMLDIMNNRLESCA